MDGNLAVSEVDLQVVFCQIPTQHISTCSLEGDDRLHNSSPHTKSDSAVQNLRKGQWGRVEVGDFRVVVMLGNAAVLSKRPVLFNSLVVLCECALNQHIKRMVIRVLRFRRFACLLGRNRESGWNRSNRADSKAVECPRQVLPLL